ncbi:hypothetical protein E4U53_000927 [Claviceps sorghi]|nr:hypothetical protein E4U53_000927 [Claviceps sorghi]
MFRNQNSRHVQAGDNGAAPPPYSETDMYCSSPRTNLAPLDDAASRFCPFASSASSSSDTGGHVIYTPPLTPRTSSRTNLYDHHSPQKQQQTQQPLLPTPPSATLYFASRPALVAGNGLPGDILVYVIKVQGSSTPGDFPYHDDWAARDVTRHDWATFVNSLLANHDATREIDAEEGSKSDAAGSSSGRSHVEVQLDNVCVGQPADAVASSTSSTSRRAIEATIQQWNDGFFGPRGMNLVLNKPQTGPDVQQDIDACVAALGGLSVDDSRAGSILLGDNNGIFTSHKEDTMGQRHAGEEDGQTARPSRNGVHDEARGRHCQDHPGENHQRSPSASSTSSSAASSSSSSASIGSLPGYDDIKEHQLPLYAERLQEWASHPDKIRTRRDVETFKAELQAAGSRPGTAQLDGMVTAVDKRALKRQIRTLQAQWKSIKKTQRHTRRAHKRERRQRRRAEKRERRQQRRAMRRAYRDLKKAKKAGWGGPATAGPWSGMPVPVTVVPPGASATATPPDLPARQAQAALPEHIPQSQRHGCGCGGPRTQPSSFFFRPDGPFGRQGLAGAGRGCPGRGHHGRWGPGFPDTGRAGERSRDDIPGAWPEVKAAHTTGMASAPIPAPGPVSAAKYRAAEQLEAEISGMAARTAFLGAGAEKLALERAMKVLARYRDRLTMEADEAYARDVAASGGWE